MKIKIERVKLYGAVSVLSKVINPKSTLPILASVKCVVKGDTLIMTGSDSEVTYTATLPLIEAEGEGEFCVSAASLNDALAALPDQPVFIITDENQQLTLIHQTGEMYFPTEGTEEYPVPQAQEFTSNVVVNGKLLAESIKRCLWCTTKDNLRPVMEGVCVSVEEGGVDVVASNGTQLVKSTILCDCENGVRVILPRKAGKILSDLLTEGDVELKVNEQFAQLEQEEAVLTFRLIEGRYPNYNSVIRAESSKKVTIIRGWLMNALRTIIPFAQASTSKVMLSFERAKLYVTGEDTDFRTGAKNSIDINYEGDPLKIAVAGSMLLSMLSYFKEESVDINMTEANQSLILTPSTEDADAAPEVEVLMLLQPMSVKE